jgi:hypothetical protein
MRRASASVFLLLLSAAAKAGSPEACIGVLRTAAYDEVSVKNSASIRDVMHHSFCNSEMSNRYLMLIKAGFTLG